MKITLAIIHQALAEHPNACIPFSGGSDSAVLLDIIYRHTPYRLPVIYVDSQLDYTETAAHCARVCAAYGAPLHIAKATRTPQQQWQTSGYPFFGKLGAANWTKKNKGKFGLRLDVSSCCRNLKTLPGRRLAKSLGCDLMLTGMRGGQDDLCRKIQADKYGAINYVAKDKIYNAHPLLGWTDTMIRRYRHRYNLPQHPARARGATAIGCVVCGGGSMFADSCLRLARTSAPDLWWQHIVTREVGYICLALKYHRHLDDIKAAVAGLGGLAQLATERPWIFDYTVDTPRVPGIN